jgi:hypothetical protein
MTFGHCNKKIIDKFSGNTKLLTFFHFLAMELGFLLSSILHIGVLTNVSDSLHVAIGLILGSMFFLLGTYIKKYELALRRSRRQKEPFKWYYLFDI